MNWDRIKGNWKQLKGGMRAGWGRLTDDHHAAIAGRREICAGRLQEAYGIGREAADRIGLRDAPSNWEAAKMREAEKDDDAGLRRHRIDARQDSL